MVNLAAHLFIAAAALTPTAAVPTFGSDEYLSALHETRPEFPERLVAVIKDSLGVAYVNGPLGEGPEGKYDQDPLVDLDHVDCVTFVEQSIALAASTEYARAFDLLQQIRYKDGEIDYESRNHFMISDWIAANTFCRDVSALLGVATDTVTRTISKRDYFDRVKAPELGRETADETIELAVVPAAAAAEAAAKLPSPALVIFVGKIDWLFALHCGFVVREEDGAAMLYHASSKGEKVVAVDFAEYLKDSERYIGFTAYAIARPPRTLDDACRKDRKEP